VTKILVAATSYRNSVTSLYNCVVCSVYRNDYLHVPIRDELWMYSDVTKIFEPFHHTARHLAYRLLGQGKI
jgi:hypothetical protein